MEMAFRMQFAVPDAFDTATETESTMKMYGESEFAKGCLLARRLVERGVRMVQISHSIDSYDIAWDTGHGNIGHHRELAHKCDQGMVALILDLKQRGLLDETLIIWGGEFGRAPTSEGQKGRDHDHCGFTDWMAEAIAAFLQLFHKIGIVWRIGLELVAVPELARNLISVMMMRDDDVSHSSCGTNTL